MAFSPRVVLLLAVLSAGEAERVNVDITEIANASSLGAATGGDQPLNEVFASLVDSMAMCNAEIDVVFLLDGSASIMKPDWELQKKFVSDVITQFELGEAGVNVAVVQFSSRVAVASALTADAERLKSVLGSLAQIPGSTATGDALTAAEKILSESNRADSVVGRLVFLLSDGAADNQAKAEKASKEIGKLRDARVFSIAIGSGVSRRALEVLATEPEGFFYASAFKDLPSILGRLMMTSCQFEDLGEAGNTVLPEVHGLFGPVLKKWSLIDALAGAIEYEDYARILERFQSRAGAVIAKLPQESPSHAKAVALLTKDQTPSTFAFTLGQMLRMAAASVNVAEAMEIEAEVEDFMNRGLMQELRAGGMELDNLRKSLTSSMKKFMSRCAAMEKLSPLFDAAESLWTAWQEAWGAIRIYVRVSTQCRPKVPKTMRHTLFLKESNQPKWSECLSAVPFQQEQFPSAVMTCARRDDEAKRRPGSKRAILDRDRMVRFMGCGRTRVQVAEAEHLVEPPIGAEGQRVQEGCAKNTKPAIEWMSSICGAGTVHTGECNVFGPFWAVYSAKVEHQYGYSVTNTGTSDCPMSVQSDPTKSCGSPQVEAFKGMVNEANAQYIYGSLPPLKTSRAKAWALDEDPEGWEVQQRWPLEKHRRLDPPLSGVLREVEKGGSVVMLAYGFSGTGKTTTLIGDSSAPIGGERGLEGVTTIYLQDNEAKIKNVRGTFFELYGRMDPGDGSLKDDLGLGLWGFRVSGKPWSMSVEYLGQPAKYTRNGQLSFEALETDLADLFVDFGQYAVRNSENKIDWGMEIKKILAEIENKRRATASFEGTPGPIAHIRATPNNPKSSRGTLFAVLEIEFKDGSKGTISAVDLAGSEDPVLMVEGFVKFMPGPVESAPQCITVDDAWETSPAHKSSGRKMIRRYLHQFANEQFLSDKLAECMQFRNFLVDCSDKPGPDCMRVQTEKDGRPHYVRPDQMKALDYIMNSKRFPHQMKPFEFDVDGTPVVFTQQQVLAAMEAGGVQGHDGMRRVLYKRSSCGATEDKKCFRSWPDRLWTRDGHHMDEKVMGQKLSKDSYVHTSVKDKTWKRKGLAARAKLGVPQPLLKKGYRGGKGRLTWIFNDDEATTVQWRQTRTRFWKELHLWYEDYQRREFEMQVQWEVHLKYFAAVVGPMVEEALFINEVLNHMKNYLSQWADRSMAKTWEDTAPLSLWPPPKNGVMQAQVVDHESPAYVEAGYDKNLFVQGKNEEMSYAARVSDGVDRIFAMALMEYMRRPAMSRGKDTKVLFGAFVRTDIPNGDKDCTGARQSLEFAQALSDSIGMRRGRDNLPHLRYD